MLFSDSFARYHSFLSIVPKTVSTYFSFKTPPGPKDLRPERRASERFSIERRIRYRGVGRSVGISGTGKTVNMSSVGMLIGTDRSLSVGSRIEVEVDGPFQVDDQVR